MSDVALTAEGLSRDQQIQHLQEVEVNGEPVIIHGSLAHAVVQGLALPPEEKFGGRNRDIDVFTHGLSGKIAVETALRDAGVEGSNPLDAGLSGLLVNDGGELVVQKDGVVVGLDDREGLLREMVDYEVPRSNGMTLRSFTLPGLLVVHSLEPHNRISHRIADGRFVRYCDENGVVVPAELAVNLEEFKRAYRERYPFGVPLKVAADIYANLLPEKFRRLFRGKTHKVMHKYAGRQDVYGQQDS